MFAGTVRENITVGRMDIGDEALEQASRRAALGSTIAELPDGFNTVVGEKGVILSGGQKQRVALARAFLKRRADHGSG